MIEHASPWPIVRSGADAFRPPKRVSVSQGAAQNLVFQQTGGYSGNWSATEAPYMIEPMDMLASRRHESVCFVGPARTGKTAGLLDGWFAYAVTCDPGDMLIVQMSQEKAREYSKTRIDRAIRHSPEIAAKMSVRASDDNTHDKLFKHGMWVKIGWPSATQLSSSDYRYVALTDYDRMPENIDGEGAAYGLAIKRTQTFLSRGMGMVESSPGREVTDPNWRPATAHEAPPCSGILGIYNRSDRRRWYWKCPDCSDYFEAKPGIELFSLLPKDDELLDIVRSADLPDMAAKYSKVVCPCCGSIIDQKLKPLLNKIETARWVGDGQIVIDGEVIGDCHQSSIAGYWLGGVAAAYQKWDSILLRYLQGLREYSLTGSELALKTTVNTDQGMPYISRAMIEASAGGAGRKTEDFEQYVVPKAARFLVASVDVQGGTKGRFIVQVHAIGEHLEQWIIARFSLSKSPRGEDIQIDPSGYAEDWSVLTNKVVNSTYRIDGENELKVLLTVVDSGGEAGATANAYAWYRSIKKSGLADRVMLVKGGSSKPESPVVKANARDPKGKPMRDVLLHIVDTDHFKDSISAVRRRKDYGPGYIHFPDWLPGTFFDELDAEIRDKSGKWKKIRARNEALDLCVYVLAGCWKLGAHKIEWKSPPHWARPAGENMMLTTREVRREIQKKQQPSRQISNPYGSNDWSTRL